jgi:hypothetical protein
MNQFLKAVHARLAITAAAAIAFLIDKKSWPTHE